VKAVDTNVLVRLIIRDDTVQLARAEKFCSTGVFVSITVVLETEWVLRSRYAMTAAAVAESFNVLIESECFHFDRATMLSWALRQYTHGADFADMIHLIDANTADGFATFDSNLPSEAGPEAPMPIVLI
jgi:predicted nucleic-acid-binding protein